MEHKGINLEEVKKNNRAAVLRTLNREGALSRKNIAEAVGLTQASVSIIVSEMINEGLLVELGELEEEKRAGRKKILVAINCDFKYVLSLGIEADKTYISVVNLSGKVIAGNVIDTPAVGSVLPEQFLATVCSKFKDLMWEEHISKDKILAVGVSLPGEVDNANGISVRAYNVWDQPVNVRAIVEQELGIDTVVENNVKAYAMMELIFGSGKNGDDLFLLKWGPGVGSAIIIDNKLYAGANGKAGEIGHIIANKNGKLCSCGSRGCLETEISASALKEEKSKNIIFDKIDNFALTIRNSIRYLDPNKIVMWGYLFDEEQYLERFIEAYKKYDPTVKDDFFIKSSLSAKDEHTEALAIVFERLF